MCLPNYSFAENFTVFIYGSGYLDYFIDRLKDYFAKILNRLDKIKLL